MGRLRPYQRIGHVRAVDVGRVDEINTQFDRAAQYSDRGVVVVGFSPDSMPRELHRAVTEAVDSEVTADVEGSGLSGGRSGSRTHYSSSFEWECVVSNGNTRSPTAERFTVRLP